MSLRTAASAPVVAFDMLPDVVAAMFDSYDLVFGEVDR